MTQGQPVRAKEKQRRDGVRLDARGRRDVGVTQRRVELAVGKPAPDLDRGERANLDAHARVPRDAQLVLELANRGRPRGLGHVAGLRAEEQPGVSRRGRKRSDRRFAAGHASIGSVSTAITAGYEPE
jgi:hypothetical protein